jgi:hypothetical protein
VQLDGRLRIRRQRTRECLVGTRGQREQVSGEFAQGVLVWDGVEAARGGRKADGQAPRTAVGLPPATSRS